ncbi:MAG: tRNA (guanosine(37)-N1)-methyltransferase TrmD [Micrococcaceae bacterium]
MKIDIISIFPEYLNGLNLSLIGKAQQDELLAIKTHQLRDFALDKHKTVDDTPYGGGAGMVMKAEPWALALENILEHKPAKLKPTLIVPSPAGKLFNQAKAEELSHRDHLIFACGRYEGIDERVFEWAKDYCEVELLSLGDYVLNGGEVASMAMIEAIVRLIPGVLGNPESLVEESHNDGLLEYAVYTKPSSWRGLGVPEELLSGHHAKIENYRRQQQLKRTQERRPDLLH